MLAKRRRAPEPFDRYITVPLANISKPFTFALFEPFFAFTKLHHLLFGACSSPLALRHLLSATVRRSPALKW